MEKQAETQKNIQNEVRIPCEVYSRIVGYLRPVQNWNHGKKQEFKERKTFVIKENTQQK
nr:anaerobic ribonucleoside-triphosphate reductase [Anaerolinea sp.]